MPAPVHVVLVARSSPQAAAQFERTLSALRSQTVPLAGLTVVVCGDPAPLRSAVSASGTGRAHTTGESAPFAAAVGLALPDVPDGRAVWLLDDASVPEPGALAGLVAALERQPSVAIAAPKLIDIADPQQLVSFGVTMSATGSSVELAGGEFDQGQHDADDDVLGVDARGVLLRADVRDGLAPDPALLGADEGLDMGVRARLGARRVALAPASRVAVEPSRQLPLTRSYVSRVARLHRRLAYAPAVWLPFAWLLLLPLALWSTAVSLFAKRPGDVVPEWMAAATVLVRIRAIARSRARIRRFRTGGWDQVDPLRLTRDEARERRMNADEQLAEVREPLRFFTGGGAWAVIAAAAVSVGVFLALLTWPDIAGGGLLPLRRTVLGLWNDATFGLRPEGLDVVAAADPFAILVAIIGSLSPAAPSFALVVLWLAALPLAVLGAWFAATRFADRAPARILVALAWGAAPSFWDALMQGRPAAVVLHLVLPWLVFVGAAAHRSWTNAGAASLLLAAVLACAPSLAPAVALLWLVSLVSAIVGARRAIGRIVWVAIPTLVVFAPLAIQQIRRGTLWGILADPGVALASGGASGLVAMGAADGSYDEWSRLLQSFGLASGDVPTWWVPLLLVPLALLALAAPLTARRGVALYALLGAAAGIVTAVGAAHVVVAWSGSDAVSLWPGSALSLAWIGILAAAAITVDGLPALTPWRALTVTVTVACATVVVIPQLTALHRGDTPLHAGTDTTLPAYVSAEASGDQAIGTLVLTPLANGGIQAGVVWGASETLGGQSTLDSTAAALTEADETVASLASDIASGSAGSVADRVADSGLSFVLLRESAGDQNSDQRTMSLTTQASMDQRSGFVRVGETARGVLWRLDAQPSERAPLAGEAASLSWTLSLVTLAIIVAALLLAFPTRSTRRAARAVPRALGPSLEEAS
ncbi:glycosyltransferase [Microbacterium indicum]|uniref:glycosyltransferase n=1 Tax=Microbacterium indicum TaxID=358100 RepID=UPI00040F10B3|nr:glycosyltransferase [Microbacterium indicum]